MAIYSNLFCTVLSSSVYSYSVYSIVEQGEIFGKLIPKTSRRKIRCGRHKYRLPLGGILEAAQLYQVT